MPKKTMQMKHLSGKSKKGKLNLVKAPKKRLTKLSDPHKNVNETTVHSNH